MCSPVRDLMRKSEPMWAVPCPGYVNSSEHDVARELALLIARPGQAAKSGVWLGLSEIQQQSKQRIQVQQGRSVFQDMSPNALTAHMGATAGGVSGPYPWRQPV